MSQIIKVKATLCNNYKGMIRSADVEFEVDIRNDFSRIIPQMVITMQDAFDEEFEKARIVAQSNR